TNVFFICFATAITKIAGHWIEGAGNQRFAEHIFGNGKNSVWHEVMDELKRQGEPANFTTMLALWWYQSCCLRPCSMSSISISMAFVLIMISYREASNDNPSIKRLLPKTI